MTECPKLKARLLAAALTTTALSLAAAGCMGDESGGDATVVVPPGTEVAETAAADTGMTDTGATETAVPEPPPVTHAQFIRRLDRICRRFNRKVDRVNDQYADAFAAGDYEASAEAYKNVQRLVPGWQVQVAALEVPPEDVGRFGRYLLFVDRLDGFYRRMIRALRQHDDEEIARLDALSERARNQRTNVAVDLGLRVCGS